LKEEKTNEFSAVLLKCFEDIISGVLGEGVKKAVLEHLEKDTGLKSDELIVQIDMLKSGMREIFGQSAPVLERMVAKQMYRKLALNTPPEDFAAAIEQAKQAYMKSYLGCSRKSAVRWPPIERN